MQKLSIFVVALLLTSCFKYVPLKPTEKGEVTSVEELVSQVKLGTEYLFGLTDGSRIEMKVRLVENDSISGVTFGLLRDNKLSIQRKNIISIQQKKPAVVKTVIITFMAVTTSAMAIAIAQDPRIY